MKWSSTSWNGVLRAFSNSFETLLPKFSGALIPVPTAVPPIASFLTLFNALSTSLVLSVIRDA